MTTPETFAQRSFLHRIGLYLMMFAVFGGVGGALIYITLMQYSGWPVSRSAGWFGMAPEGTSAKIMLYRSPTTEHFLRSVGGRYSTLIQPWRDFGRKNAVKLIEIDDLSALTPQADEVLVLPSAVALSPDERSAIKAYQARGGRLLMTWAAGSRDGSGQWVGWDFVKSVAGVQVSSELARTHSNYAVQTRGEGPLTHAFPAGSLVGLAQTAELPLQFRGAPIAAFAVDITQPGNVSDLSQGILSFYETPAPESSRVVMFGASESAWAFNPSDIHRLLNGAFDWLIRRPTVFPSDWPNGLTMAYAMAMTVDTPPAWTSAQRLAALAAKDSPPPGAFLSQEMAAQFPGTEGVRMGAALELGYSCGGGSFVGQALDPQRQRVDTLKKVFANLSATGGLFDCPDTSTDATTHQALYEAEIFSQLAHQPAWRIGLPFFAPVPKERAGQRFVVLPTYEHDDLTPLLNLTVDPATAERRLTRHLESARARGGLTIARYRPSDDANAATDALYAGLAASLISHTREIWFASPREVAAWWNDRERFQVTVRPSGARVEFDVSVIGKKVFNGGALIAMAPAKNALPKVRGLKNNMPATVVEPLDDYRAVIRFGPLSPGNYSYQLSY